MQILTYHQTTDYDRIRFRAITTTFEGESDYYTDETIILK